MYVAEELRLWPERCGVEPRAEAGVYAIARVCVFWSP